MPPRERERPTRPAPAPRHLGDHSAVTHGWGGSILSPSQGGQPRSVWEMGRGHGSGAGGSQPQPARLRAHPRQGEAAPAINCQHLPHPQACLLLLRLPCPPKGGGMECGTPKAGTGARKGRTPSAAPPGPLVSRASGTALQKQRSGCSGCSHGLWRPPGAPSRAPTLATASDSPAAVQEERGK